MEEARMKKAHFLFLFRARNSTAGAVLDGFEVVLLQPKSWQTADSRVPSHGKRPRDVEGRAGRDKRVRYISIVSELDEIQGNS